MLVIPSQIVTGKIVMLGVILFLLSFFTYTCAITSHSSSESGARILCAAVASLGLKVASKQRWKKAFTLRFLLGGGCGGCDVTSSELTSPPLPTSPMRSAVAGNGIGVADDGGGGGCIPRCDVDRVLFLANSPLLGGLGGHSIEIIGTIHE